MVETLPGIHSIDFSENKDHGMELWILNCKEATILIDTGMRDPVIKQIEQELKSINKKWSDIKHILITHKHGDHISNLKKIQELTGAPVHAHEKEAPLIKEVTGVTVKPMKDGETLPYCGGIQIIHVPGHSEGNSCYYLPAHKTIIAGDTIFGDPEGTLTTPPEKYCLDVKQAEKEIKRLLDYDLDKLLYTHGKDILKDAKQKIKKLIDNC